MKWQVGSALLAGLALLVAACGSTDRCSDLASATDSDAKWFEGAWPAFLAGTVSSLDEALDASGEWLETINQMETRLFAFWDECAEAAGSRGRDLVRLRLETLAEKKFALEALVEAYQR